VALLRIREAVVADIGSATD